MKRFFGKLKHNKRGETLVESIVSLLIFSFIIVVVVTFAATGLNIVRYSNEQNQMFNEQAAAVDGGSATGVTMHPAISVSFDLQDQAGITRNSVVNSPLESKPIIITDRGLVSIENE